MFQKPVAMMENDGEQTNTKTREVSFSLLQMRGH
jgi:hypothetical protein